MSSADPQEQYGRVWRLLVGDNTGNLNNALDLSELRIKFVVKKSNSMTPNVADIRVYNLSEKTAIQIKKEFKKVILEAGYEGNSGVIFKGNIKQVIIGRESATDTFVDIMAGDGDLAFNFSIINKTLAAGASLQNQVDEAIKSMNIKGVTAGSIEGLNEQKLTRGKVMYGNSREFLRAAAESSNTDWSIQEERVNFVPVTSYLPGEVVVLTSETGMIGTPQQTNEGLNVKCLLNPKIKVGGRIQVDVKSVADYKIDLTAPLTAKSVPFPKSYNGVYNVYVMEYTGDTRGVEWYTSLVCLTVSLSSNPLNSVGTN